MELLVKRRPSTDGATLGELFVDGQHEAFTLEDVIREGPKIAHETAIPAGRYEVTITRSQRFEKMLPLVNNVPGFSGIRIHGGNVAADTSGCLLVGQSARVNSITDSQLALTVLQSKIAGAIARGERCWLTIENPGGPQPLNA